jgi:hypothetical protein
LQTDDVEHEAIDLRKPVSKPLPAAGWYPDPAGAPMLRYFDGADWTEHRAPVAAAPSAVGVMTNPRPSSATAVIAGAGVTGRPILDAAD